MPETVKRFYDEVVRLLHVNVQQAERMARATFQMAERLGDDASRAAGLRALGHIYYRKRKYEASLRSLREVARDLPDAWATNWRPAARSTAPCKI